MGSLEIASPMAFWELARGVVTEARRHGLTVPSFRSPPRLQGAVRTVRRYPDGHCLVSVQARGRPAIEVVADMVEGLIVANRLQGPAAEACRTGLMAALVAAPSKAA